MMSVENIVQFVVRHNTTLIEVLIGVILVLALLLMIRSFLSAKEEVQGGSSANLGDLEETLKKLLEKANSVPTGLHASADGSDAAQLVAEINTLKLELDQKKKEIEDIKTAPAGAGAQAAAPGASMSDEDKAKLEAKIKELEGKLSEYEIISEDIADLSFYKEQNTKLQKELEAVKAGGAGAAPAPAATAEAPAPAKPSGPEPEIAGKAKATPPPEPEAEPVVAAPAEESAPAPKEASPAAAEAAPASTETPAAAEPVVNDDLLAEFAAAIEKQKSGDDGAAAPAVEPQLSAEPPPAAEAAPTEEASAIDLGILDMDKVIAEASGIQEPTQEVKAEDALGTGLDENKLLEEAAALQAVNPEDQKLMGQFENFVKKGE